MRALAWNCWSAGRSSTVRALKELIREPNPDLVFLLETKIKSPRIANISNRLNFSQFQCVKAGGKSRGLALF